MTTAAYHVATLLEKMNSNDKDFRFMAVNDLMREVQEGVLKMDEDTERKVIRALGKLLSDKNGEVQNLSVKFAGVLVVKIRDAQADFLLEMLYNNLISGGEDEKDISSLALKTVITSLGSTSPVGAAGAMKKLLPKLNVALGETKPSSSNRLDILDIMSDILMRFGSSLDSLHDQTLSVLLNELESDRQAARKRATIGLSHLTAFSHLFNQTVDVLSQRAQEAKTPTAKRTYVVALTYVAKSSGSRFAHHIPKVAPLLLRLIETDDDDLKEAVMQAFECFFQRCPLELSSYQPDIQKVLIKNLSYDPNYCVDNDADDVESMEVEEDDEDNDDYSDDDDMSWKVRRAAARALEAMILSRRDQLSTLLKTVGPILINRMREREENVRCDVFNAYIALLKQARLIIPHPSAALWSEEDAESAEAVKIGEARFARSKLSAEQVSVLESVNDNTEMLIKSVTKQMKGKSFKSRLTCCELLSQLSRTLPNSLSNRIASLMPGIEANLTDKSGGAQMKMDTLSFIACLLRSHDPEDFKPLVPQLVSLIVSAINDNFYKASAEALVVASKLVPALKISDPAQQIVLFDAVFQKLNVNDIDQDVKERAIASTALFISSFGENIDSKVAPCLRIFVERLRNEMTRLAAVRALLEVAASSYSSYIGAISEEILPLLAEFLKKNHRALKLSTLHLIRLLLSSDNITGLDNNGISSILGELPALFKDSDLQISQAALKCLTLTITRFPSHVASHLTKILSSLIYLIQSALLLGATLQSTFDAVRALVVTDIPGKPGFEDLLDAITLPIYESTNLPRQAFYSISAVTAVVATANNDLDKAKALVGKLADQLQNPASSDQIRLFCIHAIGELGRRCAEVFDSSVDPGQLMITAFNSPQEDLKTAAAHAIGALAVGNLNKYLPFILNQIQTEPKRQYLLLHSLKEVIAYENDDSSAIELFKDRIDEIWTVLIKHAHCSEEGTRNVVAECMGKLCVVAPEIILPKLKSEITSTDASIRACIVTSVKFMISHEKRAIDGPLQESMELFLSTISDDDLGVRRVALVVLNSAAHNKPSLINDLLPKLLSSVYQETKIRKDLIREVEMGPFKHLVDDGLDLRKAAFECMYTLLESCLDRLEILDFIQHVEQGLEDHHHDIKLLTFLTVIRLASYCPTQVRMKLEKICEKIKEQLNRRSKSNAVKQELEKLEELKRAAIRVVFALQNIPEAEHQQQLIDLSNTVKNNPELKTLADQVLRDSQRTFITDVAMESV